MLYTAAAAVCVVTALVSSCSQVAVTKINGFYPSDTLLPRLLAMALCPCLYLPQVRVLSKRMNGIIWFFGFGASFDQSYTVFYGNSGIYKNMDTSLLNFFLNSGLTIISPRHIDRRTYQLSSRKLVAPSVIYLDIVVQLS